MPPPAPPATATAAPKHAPGRGWLAGLLLALLACSSAAQTVRYPAPEMKADARGDYPVQVLELALRKSGRPWQASPSAQPMVKGRAVLELLRPDGGLDVIWAQTNAERENLLRPIRLPIDRGLIGWRVALLRTGDAERFADVRELEDLREHVAGQGHDWPDLKILQANGLKVTAVNSYPALFSMLALGRFDYLPRSLGEYREELRQQDPQQITLDRHLLLHYPAALYFFVRKDNAALAQALTEGLNQALRDGSLKALFDSHYGAAIRAADMANRRVIRLHNPLLPTELPLAHADWWWQPEEALPESKPSPPRPAGPGPQRLPPAGRKPGGAASAPAAGLGGRPSSG